MRTITRMGLSTACAVFMLVVHMGCGRGNNKASVATQPHNLVIIVADALRRDILGCYGGPGRTPNIDRLAREGTLFENAYSTAPCTLPSSVAMLTGNYSRSYIHFVNSPDKSHETDQNRYYCFHVPDSEELLAEKLNTAGWDTRAYAENPVILHSNIHQGLALIPTKASPDRSSPNKIYRGIGFRSLNHHFRGITNALSFLSSRPFSRKKFLLAWILDPHSPYNPPDAYRTDLADTEALLPKPPRFYSEKKCSDLNTLLRKKNLKPRETDYIRTLYRLEVESVDERVGYILRTLEKTGSLERTLIVFTSDHGELLGEHKRIGHSQSFNQDLVRVPLIFRGPGIPAGSRVKTRVTHLGLTPTLAEMTGVRFQRTKMGKSYAPLFRGRRFPSRTAYFDLMVNSTKTKWRSWDGILEKNMKLLENRRESHEETQLFDIAGDPDESRNLAQDLPETVRKLRALATRFRLGIQQKHKENVSKLKKDDNLSEKAKKTRETLKSLGYL